MAHRATPPGTHRVKDHEGGDCFIETDELLRAAHNAAVERFAKGPRVFAASDATRYLEAIIGHLEQERFCALWLDNKHRVIRFDTLFIGTLDSISVHPREVVKTALAVNAAAVILAHNHPSGDATPSRDDREITQRLKAALELVDIRLLDHLIIGETPFSMASCGLL